MSCDNYTLESGIDVGQGINVGPWTNVGHKQNEQSYVAKNPSNLKKAMEKITKFNKHRTFNNAVWPGKNPKLINIGPTFISDYREVST